MSSFTIFKSFGSIVFCLFYDKQIWYVLFQVWDVIPVPSVFKYFLSILNQILTL